MLLSGVSFPPKSVLLGGVFLKYKSFSKSINFVSVASSSLPILASVVFTPPIVFYFTHRFYFFL